MDFWDITKLLVRRWIVAVPMLAVSAVLSVLTVQHVHPDYKETAYVQLVPPVSAASQPGQSTVDQRNPWIGLGLQTIGNAAIVTVTDLSVADQLKSRGLTDSYTVTMGQSSPLVTFEVVGTSADQATSTADQLISQFSASVANLQSSYGVQQADLITTRRLDVGTNVSESSSKMKRALIAVAGASVLITIASTIGFDALLRRRNRRAAERAGQASEAVGPDPVVTPATSAVVARKRPVTEAVTFITVAEPLSRGAVVPGSAPVPTQSAERDTPARRQDVDHRQDSDQTMVLGLNLASAAASTSSLTNAKKPTEPPAAQAAADSEDGLDVPVDATIVLALPALRDRPHG